MSKKMKRLGKQILNEYTLKSEPSFTDEEVIDKISLTKIFSWYQIADISNNVKKKWVVEYLQLNKCSEKFIKKCQEIPEQYFYGPVPVLARLSNRGRKILDSHREVIIKKIESNFSKIPTEKSKTVLRKSTKPPKVLPFSEKLTEIFSEIDYQLDLMVQGQRPDFDLDIYCRGKILNNRDVIEIIKYCQNILDEFEVLKNKKCDADIKEAYSHLMKRQVNYICKTVNGFISDMELLARTLKKTKNPRKKRPVDKAKIVSKFRFLKTAKTLPINSLDPIKIFGASSLLLFDEDKRTLKYLKAQSGGFEVSGTTIKNFDAENSFSIRVRENEKDFMSSFSGFTEKKLLNRVEDLTTKKYNANGRSNENTLLVKIYS